MQPKLKIKKGDEVIVVTGKDKGKKGQVLEVMPTKARLKVQGINMVKRHRRPTQTSPGGIENFEASMHISNVAHVDPDSGKATRVGSRVEDGNKVRVAKASGKVIS
ncbi:50S ribosomal protein L24 [Alphaproteobacteria bacterium]|nr:50S ribosomal protein L24 [Alphaproteobacteria bacterium]